MGPVQQSKAVDATLADLDQSGVPGRIWRKDHTVWKPSPEEIADRLGWLHVTDVMRQAAPTLHSFANEVRDGGFHHVVLLGMGGSSLGPEVLRQTFGSAPGYPELIVLDSVVPASVVAATEAIEPSRALFLVSSKSGTTVEPNVLYKYFRGLVEEAAGKKGAGSNFVAITDSGTPLEAMAEEQGFRRVFQNPSDIGGRYSVLSYFGLVPAALTGLDLGKLLDAADAMRSACAGGVPTQDNPGAVLGATMGALALEGRDKLTLVTSPSVEGFGLWVEQLIAESLGKEGTGIVPVADEPRSASPMTYGDDRLFVYLRLDGDQDEGIEREVAELEAAGQPVVRLELRDRYDIGGEFFRWELATAVAGAVLGLNPFDQPDVQRAKDSTDAVLREYERTGSLPEAEVSDTFDGLLAKAKAGDYLAIMAFLRQTPSADDALQAICARVVREHGIATTLGYGPRFLHSTGQLHKGGPDSGLFLQITADHAEDVSIPGEPFTFGVLADAQALGDLRALQDLGRSVVHLHLGADVEDELRRITSRSSDT